MASVPVDLGRAAGRPFLVAAGIGFDAAVARSVNEQPRWLRGSLAYAVAVLSTLRTYQPTLLHISVDGVTQEHLAYMAAVANIRTYGGGMRIAPNASIRDGMLDVCVVQALPRWRFLLAAGSVYRGAHVRHPAVRMYRGRTIRIQSEPPAPVVLDGELAGATPVELSVEPGGIRLAIQSPYDSI
jgi:diacylglycerol kinase family enzyme